MDQIAAYHHPHRQHRDADDGIHDGQRSEAIARALTRAEAICRAGNARLTPIRRRVLETLYLSGQPLGAYDLAETLGTAGRRTAPITVYRALEFLIEQGLVHRLASLNAYIAPLKTHDGGGMSAFLICEQCGSVDEMTSPEIITALNRVLAQENFSTRSRLLELTGRCSRAEAFTDLSSSHA